MGLKGAAFIALWNDRSPQRNDYDVWHTREHVPQRLTVPGISQALRFSTGRGPLPRYFTLYSLQNLGVLDSEPYNALLHDPTPWTLSMRPDFSRFLRLPCRVVASAGGGVGGWCVVCLIVGQPKIADLQALVGELVDLEFVTAVHLGITDDAASGMPFAMPLDGTERPFGVLVVEGFVDHELSTGVSALLNRFAALVTTDQLTAYSLAFALDADVASSIHPYAQRVRGSSESMNDG